MRRTDAARPSLLATLGAGSNLKPLGTPYLVRDHCEVYRNGAFGAVIALHLARTGISSQEI